MTNQIQFRPVWAEIDLAAIRHNVETMKKLAGQAELLAVVKADGYGHGAVEVSKAALTAGASWLGVALVEEGIELRHAGITAPPILVLSQPPPASVRAVVENNLTPVVYTKTGTEALAAVAGRPRPLNVHLKVDTGMHRIGVEPERAVELARLIESLPQLHLQGLMTHFAVADEPDNPFTKIQIERFERVIAELAAAGIKPEIIHAANSAGTICFPEARYDLVRCGIAIYGIDPTLELSDRANLQPALSLKAKVSLTKGLLGGERISYGQRYELKHDANVATVPIGYADGVTRQLGGVGGEVLINGRRYPIAGTVTMDQLMVDCGNDPVKVDDEVVLIGSQGDEAITAWDWAQKLSTIAYEVTCGIGPRVPRRYLNDG